MYTGYLSGIDSLKIYGEKVIELVNKKTINRIMGFPKNSSFKGGVFDKIDISQTK